MLFRSTFYAVDATFRDPFNHVRGVKAIRRIFEHMFLTVDEPQFRVHDTMNEIIKAGRDPNSLQSSLWSTRIIGIICMSVGAYLLSL